MSYSDELLEAAGKVELLLMDCDGVLTDGRLYFTEHGESMKVFHVRDGQGLDLWHKAGFRSGIITGRGSEDILKIRKQELGIQYLYVNSNDKLADYNQIIRDAKVERHQVAFIGDDVGDLPLLNLVGFPVAVADAVPEAAEAAKFVTSLKGGEGAVREVIDMLLAAGK